MKFPLRSKFTNLCSLHIHIEILMYFNSGPRNSFVEFVVSQVHPSPEHWKSGWKGQGFKTSFRKISLVLYDHKLCVKPIKTYHLAISELFFVVKVRTEVLDRLNSAKSETKRTLPAQGRHMPSCSDSGEHEGPWALLFCQQVRFLPTKCFFVINTYSEGAACAF